MILQESKTVPIAEADWTDDGEVELLTYPDDSGRTHMTPETARALAQQLVTAAADAEKAAGETGVQRAHRTAHHAFDVNLGILTPEQARANLGITDKRMHDWRWQEGSSDPVCSHCGLRAVTSLVQATTCPGPFEAPGVRS